jgi:hypothetical protein
MTESPPAVGWHADLEANRYRYWDGERWAWTSSARDLDAYRQAGQTVPGVDFTAPVHSELPPEEKPRRFSTPLAAGLGAAALVALVVVLVVVL